MAGLSDEVAALATMSPAQLRAEWRRIYRVSPPGMTPDLLMRGIAYRLQERRHGGLTAATVRELDRRAKDIAAGQESGAMRERQLKPGTRLVRQWGGKTHVVLVTDDGFVFDDRRFVSLSQIAKAITGAHWSGPRFFGVKASQRTTGAAAVSARRVKSAAPIEARDGIAR